jgi:hypothetical protein
MFPVESRKGIDADHTATNRYRLTLPFLAERLGVADELAVQFGGVERICVAPAQEVDGVDGRQAQAEDYRRSG